MRVLSVTLFFIGLFVGLCFFASKTVPQHIQSSIQSDILYRFSLSNLHNVMVNVDGRDVTLLGEVKSQQEINTAIKIASHRPGVRVVMTEMKVNSPELLISPTDTNEVESKELN